MAMYTAQALAKVNQMGLKAQDYGWDGKFTTYSAQKIGNWTPQYLANALGEPVYTQGQDGKDYVAAYPGGSVDPFTKQAVPASGPDKNTVIQEIQQLANYAALSQFGTSPALPNLQEKSKDIWQKAQSVGITADEFNSTFNNYYKEKFPQYLASYKEQNNTGGLLGFVEKATPIITNIGAGIVTGGLSFTEQLTANALIGLAKGANPTDIVRNVAATIASNSLTQGVPGVESSKAIPETLQKINQAISNAAPGVVSPTVASALINAERQAVYALATGQDVGNAALAGVTGGAVSDVGLLATDNAAIARAAGEYSQALAAGMTQEQALTKALSGFVLSEQAAAKQKVLDTAGTTEKTTSPEQTTDVTGTGNATVTTAQGGDKSLSPVTVTATADPNQQLLDLISTDLTTKDNELKSLGNVTVQATGYDNAAGNLSTISTADTATKDETKGQTKTGTGTRDTVLLSLLNQPLDRTYVSGGSQGPTQTQLTYGPGSQALAQALRIGDAGLPVFGGDKEKSKKSGWNVESLRYMGNSEA